MSLPLHLTALAFALVGICCQLTTRSRYWRMDTALALLMLTAMADTAFSTVGWPPVLWAGLLLLAAMTAAAIARSRRDDDIAATRHGSLHEQLSLIVGALLIASMPTHGPQAIVTAGGHHGAAGSQITILAAVTGASFAVMTAASGGRQRGTRRLHRLAMSAAITMMSASVMV